MQEFDWDSIKAAMKLGVVEVTFTKVNGTVRTMECTLADYLLPETGGGRATTASNPDIVVVYDIASEGWRSFKKSTVTDVVVL
jgi:hypothetical protein